MTSQRFAVEPGWQALMLDLGVAPQDVLRRAQLPLDLFNRPGATVSTAEYFTVFQTLADAIDAPEPPLVIGRAISTEAFSPALFACMCSPDLNVAIVRLAEYKPLIGPIRLHVAQTARSTTIEVLGQERETQVSPCVAATEIVFFTELARLATREPIKPISAVLRHRPQHAELYDAHLGVALSVGSADKISFSAEDAARPFLTANAGMWSVFEPELARRLADLKAESRFRDRVRACLMETVASGQCSISDVARRLAVSERSLQRRLADEGTSFQRELALLREELARHYLTKTRHTSAEISFLLGYKDPNSFTRAFHSWAGVTPEALRLSAQSGAV